MGARNQREHLSEKRAGYYADCCQNAIFSLGAAMTDLLHTLIDTPLPGVARITLNRPEKRNALNNQLRGEIFATLQANDNDPQVRVTTRSE